MISFSFRRMGNRWRRGALLGLLAGGLAGLDPAFACNADLYLGSVCTTAARDCPRDFREADGRLLPIAQNQALFALIGGAYGGDGKTTFALPNLRDRLPIGAGPLTTEGRVMVAGAAVGEPLMTSALRFCVKVAGTWPPTD